MTPRDWQLFLASGQEKPIKIAQIAHDLAAYLGAASNCVHLGHSYAVKAIEKHGLGIEHFPLIFETVDYGIAVADKPGHITFYHEDIITNLGWHQVTVKCAKADNLLYLSTFYKQRKREVERRLKLYSILRK